MELNDVGFLRNTDQVLQFVNVDYLWLVPNETFRNMSVNFEESSEYDFDGNLNRLRFELASNVNWINNERTRVGIGANFSRFNNFFFVEVQDGDRRIVVIYSFLLIRIMEKNLAIIRATLMPILMKMFSLEIDSISDSITSLLMPSMCL